MESTGFLFILSYAQSNLHMFLANGIALCCFTIDQQKATLLSPLIAYGQKSPICFRFLFLRKPAGFI